MTTNQPTYFGTDLTTDMVLDISGSPFRIVDLQPFYDLGAVAGLNPATKIMAADYTRMLVTIRALSHGDDTDYNSTVVVRNDEEFPVFES